MKPWSAILFTFGLFFVSATLSVLLHLQLVWFLVLSSALWAAIDSSRIKLIRYKSGISSSPLTLFIGCALLWIVGFPWYLTIRYKIKSGTATLKEVPAPVPCPPAALTS